MADGEKARAHRPQVRARRDRLEPAAKLRHILEGPPETPMRIAFASPLLVLLTAGAPAPVEVPFPAPAQHACANDYLTIQTITGTIMEIKPAPEPFRSADIDITGPAPCERLWMQVLKRDADLCHVGDAIEARGVVTSDPENNAWQINPLKNEYMTLADDFTCHS
jgi:hypothetical protein